MYRGKRDELEYAGVSGVFYSVWFEAGTEGGAVIEIEGFSAFEEMSGDAFDDVEEAADAIEAEIVGVGAFEEFLDRERRADWIAAIIEENRLVEGVDTSSADAWRTREIGYERDGGYYDLSFREGADVPW